MTAKEAIDYIENYTWSSTRLGLDRTRELLKAMGDPHKDLKFVHVAGSNGKGSTCAMLDNILRSSGYRVGLYTSPYIQEFNERMQVNGVNIEGDKLAKLTEQVKAIAEGMEDHPSQFELVTAIAMQFFKDEKCDIVVLEVGMGGALDSTNVIDAPEVAIITNIGLEHTEYLGDTLEKIATTKSGIIKSGCSCVCYDGAPEVTEVITNVCKEKNVPLSCVDFSKLELISETLEGQNIKFSGRPYRLNLLGEHQLHNCCVVMEAVEALRKRGWTISEEALSNGLATVKWPARLEVLSKKPLFLLDGGHNPQCAEALSASLKNILEGKKAVFLMGVLADKDYKQVLDFVKPYASEFVCLTPFSERALSAYKLSEYLNSIGEKATAVPGSPEPSHDVTEEAKSALALGLKMAKEAAGEDGIIVCFGSLYLVGHIRGLML